MKYIVIRRFKCKITHRVYLPGDVYEADKKRCEFLKAKGYLGESVDDISTTDDTGVDETPELTDDELLAQCERVGVGFYILPDGIKVHGKAKALEAMRRGK